jgi:hypothetical protein
MKKVLLSFLFIGLNSFIISDPVKRKSSSREVSPGRERDENINGSRRRRDCSYLLMQVLQACGRGVSRCCDAYR